MDILLRVSGDFDLLMWPMTAEISSYARAILGTCVFGTLWALLPPEIPVDRGGNIDWIGGVLGTSGLITFNFVWK